jgi:hypothetical protein
MLLLPRALRLQISGSGTYQTTIPETLTSVHSPLLLLFLQAASCLLV